MSLLDQLNQAIGDTANANDTIPYWLPTPLPNINAVLSDRMDGGFAGGRIIEISGPESSGKTALATAGMVAAQRDPNGIAMFLDHEFAFMLAHAVRLGLDESRFYYKQPISAEESTDTLFRALHLIRCSQTGYDFSKVNYGKEHVGTVMKFLQHMRSRGVDGLPPFVAVIDSIAAMVPEAGNIAYGDQNMKTKNMEKAQFLSVELPRLARDLGLCAGTTFALNQLRTNPGVMFGDNTTTPGGQALKFYASTRLRLRKAGKVYASWDDKASEAVGDVVEMAVLKNKVARPLRKTQFIFRTADPVGLDLPATMVLLGKEAGCLGPAGGKTIEFGGKKRWGIDEFLAECRTNHVLVADITKHVMPVVAPSLRAEHSNLNTTTEQEAA